MFKKVHFSKKNLKLGLIGEKWSQIAHSTITITINEKGVLGFLGEKKITYIKNMSLAKKFHKN